MPARVGDYTDFYVGIHHATNVGKLFRPDNPLLPNYKWVPIGYHGRASSVRRRPAPRCGARTASASRATETVPSFGPCRNLDYELELGIWIGPGNALGAPIPIGEAPEHIAGFCLLNDWSARDIQAWEYQPLGPFLAKNFRTTISAWVVTPEALAPFRVAAAAAARGRSGPLPYLLDAGRPAARRARSRAGGAAAHAGDARAGLAPHRLSHRHAAEHVLDRRRRWSPITPSNGCNLQPRRPARHRHDLGADAPTAAASLLEMTRGRQGAGRAAVRRDAPLPGGRRRGRSCAPARAARASRRSASASAAAVVLPSYWDAA